MHARIPVFVCVGKGGRVLFILPRVNFNSQTGNNRPVARNSNRVVLLYKLWTFSTKYWTIVDFNNFVVSRTKQ